MDGPTDVDALADALRQDGVVIDRVMGSGEAQEAHDRIAKLVRETPFPLYVALVANPSGISGNDFSAPDSLATLLSRRLGDGMYVIHLPGNGERVYTFGQGAEGALVSLTASSNRDKLDAAMAEIGGFEEGTEDYVYTPAISEAEAVALSAEDLLEVGRTEAEDGYPATLSDADADRLAEQALAIQERARWSPWTPDLVDVHPVSAGESVMRGGLAALLVALLLGQSLRGWPRYRKGLPAKALAKPTATPPPDPAAERARATELLDILVTKLEETHWDTVRDHDVAGRALTARDAAEPLLGSEDVADLVGAQVLARTGARDLARGRSGNGGPLVTCFFDPRHPEGKATVSWRLGDGEVDVPCCTTCARTVAKGGVPEHLRLRSRRSTVPYWERDDVWARTGFGAVADDLARDVLAARAEDR
jgi:hypothetical protein